MQARYQIRLRFEYEYIKVFLLNFRFASAFIAACLSHITVLSSAVRYVAVEGNSRQVKFVHRTCFRNVVDGVIMDHCFIRSKLSAWLGLW